MTSAIPPLKKETPLYSFTLKCFSAATVSKPEFFYDHFMIFYHIQKCHNRFIIMNGNDIITDSPEYTEKFYFPASLQQYRLQSYLPVGKVTTSPVFRDSLHTICASRLYTDDFNLRIQQFCKYRYTRCQVRRHRLVPEYILPAEVPERFPLQWFPDRLQPPGSSKGWIKSISVLFCQLICFCTSLIIYISVQDNFCTITLRTVYFDPVVL